MQQEVLLLYQPISCSDHFAKFSFCDVTVWNILDLLPAYGTADWQSFLQTATHGCHSENLLCVLLCFKGWGGGLPLKQEKLTLLF